GRFPSFCNGSIRAGFWGRRWPISPASPRGPRPDHRTAGSSRSGSVGAAAPEFAAGGIQPLECLIDVGQRHGRAEPVVTGRAAVVVKIHAVADGRPDEPQHLLPVVANSIPIAADFL